MTDADAPALSAVRWALRGAGHILSLPVLVLAAAQVGFTTLAREAGLSLAEVVFITVTVWALPSQVLFVGLTGAGTALPAIAAAVALASVRFMPMVMAWTPVVRAPRTPRWQLLLVSWFVAITAWVFAMAKLPELPRAARLPFFAGFAVTLTLANAAVVAFAYLLIERVPDGLAAAFVFLTPVYFLLAIWGASKAGPDRLAMVFGLALGPLFAWAVPQADILAAGLVGGTAAYIVHRLRRRSRSGP